MILAIAITSALTALSLDVNGAPRTYELYAPPGVAARAPLVIMLHGRLGTGAQLRASSGFDEVARARGFVVAYPDGVDRAWRDLRQRAPSGSTVSMEDDAAFLLALIDELERSHDIDRGRVFVAGHSNGAMMALSLACAHADRVAGVAAVAGNVPAAECAPSRPVPALFFHGTKDGLVPFEGGGVGPRGGRGQVRSSDDSVALFAAKAGCTGASRTTRAAAAAGRRARGAVAVVLDERTGCSAPVRRFILEGGGHGWPGRGPIWRDNTRALDASAEIGAFFGSLALPPLAPAPVPAR